MMQRIGVLGAGTWGMALARMLAVRGHRVTVWSALPHEVEQLAAERVHPNLPGMVIPEDIVFTKDNRRVAHFAQKEPKTAEELKQMIDIYYNVLLEEIQNDSERAEK